MVLNNNGGFAFMKKVEELRTRVFEKKAESKLIGWLVGVILVIAIGSFAILLFVVFPDYLEEEWIKNTLLKGIKDLW